MKNETDELIEKINSYYSKKSEISDQYKNGLINTDEYYKQLTELEKGTSFMDVDRRNVKNLTKS